MPRYIMYFNLKNGVIEEDFVKKLKEWLIYIEGKIEGAKAESTKLFRHHYFGAHPRTYQTHFEFEDFGAWDRFSELLERDEKAAKLMQNWHDLMDFKMHFDEFVREIPLQ